MLSFVSCEKKSSLAFSHSGSFVVVVVVVVFSLIYEGRKKKGNEVSVVFSLIYEGRKKKGKEVSVVFFQFNL